MRIGHGFDVHAFTSGRPLILGGVNIPYDKGLAAHSDGDVVIHALCDALLGAAALGDIGQHFPDSDPEFKNIDSRVLLRRVVELLKYKGWRTGNADISVIAQAPKMAPHINAMRENISSVMEKDYFGALFGGIGFAFFALPYLGLTYTPILLGAINFSVAALLLWRFSFLVDKKIATHLMCAFTLVLLLILFIFAPPIIRYGEQKKYRDKIIYSMQTRHQKIVITQWKKYYWLYINGQEQFSTFDEEKYHEPLVHPAMQLSVAQKAL